MLEKLPLSDQQILNCLRNYYSIVADSITFLPLGADSNAAVYKIDAHDTSSYFIKLKHGHHHDISIDVIELLQKHGIQQIIPPIKTNDGKSIQFIDDFSLIVYPFIVGTDGFNLSLTDEQWIKLGDVFKKIHSIPVPTILQHRLRREMFSSKWRDIVRKLYSTIEAKSCGDESALNLSKFMQKNIALIHRLVNRADELAHNIHAKVPKPKFMLCHSDIHAGNILIGADNSIYIVDWDEPIMAPKERDLMFIGGGVGNVWNNPAEEALFYQGYGKTEINLELLTYYRHERIVEDIAIYAQDLLLTDAGGSNRSEMYKHFVAMFEPNGVVEIAFRGDEYPL